MIKLHVQYINELLIHECNFDEPTLKENYFFLIRNASESDYTAQHVSHYLSLVGLRFTHLYIFRMLCRPFKYDFVSSHGIVL